MARHHGECGFCVRDEDQLDEKTKILLVEDNRLLRDGIKALIDKQRDLRILETSGGVHDPVLQARELQPQVVLIDLG